jgi:hypothetical protein
MAGIATLIPVIPRLPKMLALRAVHKIKRRLFISFGVVVFSSIIFKTFSLYNLVKSEKNFGVKNPKIFFVIQAKPI